MLKSSNEWLPSMRAGCDNPGVQSLYKMLTVYAADYVGLGSALRHLALSMEAKTAQEIITSEDRAEACRVLPEIEERCQKIELRVATATVKYWKEQFIAGHPRTYAEGRYALEEIERTVRYELSDTTFLYVERSRSLEFEKMRPDEIGLFEDDLWPLANRNLERARLCYIADQFTASVFHSMRAAEKVLTTMAKSLGVEYKRASWQSIIEGIESAVRDLDKLLKGDEREKKQSFYSGMAMQLRYMKNAWRNHVMHGRLDYDEKEARDTWWHVKRTVDIAREELEESIED